MPTSKELQAAPKATVVEPGVQLGRVPMWELYHYEYGQRTGQSIARGDQLHQWLTDLEQSGRMLGFGWELRGQDAPADWPGWPITEDEQDAGPRR
ncbi:hypothetical protein LUW76_46845 [Actinomadura madurae]|uniref:hypothetical protein n=1 Tax=Actinomadura madurae TaxID=1993 RepID=UPI0020260C52|nr:hypothetical protein [Actinomadura madurae]URN01218.1 hypothetical protein LUW76_46845 [Actinomadura madurae]